MTLSEKEKKYAIVTVAVLAAVLAYEFVIAPFVKDYDTAKAQTVKVNDNITRANMLFATERQKRVSWSKMLSAGLQGDLSKAQSQAQYGVLQWAFGAGVTVSASQGEAAARQEGKFLVSTFKFTGIGTMRSIARWMNAIELGSVPNGRIPLRIDDLTITPRKPGTDDLQAVVTVSTLCLLPDATATGSGPVAFVWEGR